MSQENVAIVRSGIAAWNRRDADLWLTYAAPEIEWVPAGPAAVESTVYSGSEEVTRGLAAVWDTWEVFEFGESEVRDLGDSVLWLGNVKMRGGTSHVELDQEFALQSLLRDGKFIRVGAFLSWIVMDFGSDHRITRVRIFWDVSQTLRAVGLAE